MKREHRGEGNKARKLINSGVACDCGSLGPLTGCVEPP